MATSRSSYYWHKVSASWLSLATAIACWGNDASAQIVPDVKLGAESSVVTPDSSGLSDVISGGATRGGNLFHSFEQFSILTGRSAFFNNAPAIQNIISRVTGGSVSNIDGLLRANGKANLFLINPNGMIFGPNARLDIGGSFVGSTANAVNFADGTQFSAKAPQNTPLLTVSVPIGLQIGATAGDIRVQGSALAVQPGKNLTLVGSEVDLESGSLVPPRGLIEIDAGGPEVSLSQIVPDATLPVNSIVTPQGNASIIAGGTVAGSNLFHSFEQFSVSTGSIAYFNNALDIQNIITRVTGSASNIDGSIAANGNANLFLLNPNGIIFGPNAKLNIGGSILASTASAIKFADGASFSATAHPTTPLLSMSVPSSLQFGETAGDIRVQRSSGSTGSDLFVGLGRTFALVGGDLTIGNVDPTLLGGVSKGVSGGRIELGSVAGSGEVSLSHRGNSWVLGYDDVNAFGDISLERGAVSVHEKGGSIQIQSATLEMTQGSDISATTAGGTEVLIKTTEAISLSDGSVISSKVVGQGTAGSLRIETGKLIVREGARVLAELNGKEQEGTLTVFASDSVELSGTGSGIFTVTQPFAGISALGFIREPTVGSSTINTNTNDKTGRSYGLVKLEIPKEQGETLTATGVAVAQSTVNGIVGRLGILTEQGETLLVNALGPAQLISSTSDYRLGVGFPGIPSGRAVGDLKIETGKLIVRDGAEISTATLGERPGGNLAVTASDFVELMGNSRLNTSTLGTGTAGDLTIKTGQLNLRDGAEVTVSSLNSGNAGNLEVVADSIRLDNRATLSADTRGGQGNIILRSGDLILRGESNITTNAIGTASGGNITIDTDVLAALENSDINANAQNARGGRVIIDTQGIFGTEFREQLTPESDITASSDLGSEFSGTVEINNPDVDPEQGLVELPAELVDASSQIASGGCAAGENKFSVVGRGGLPPNPREPLNGEAVLTNWATLSEGAGSREQGAGSREQGAEEQRGSRSRGAPGADCGSYWMGS